MSDDRLCKHDVYVPDPSNTVCPWCAGETPYGKYAVHLRELYCLGDLGLNEAAAEVICDKMDSLWLQLTAAEQDKLAVLSAQLAEWSRNKLVPVV